MRDNSWTMFIKALRRQGAYSTYDTADGTELIPVCKATGTQTVGSLALSDIQNAGITAGTVAASRALVVDGNKDLATLRHLTLSGNVRRSVATPAATGTSQGTGTALTADLNLVTGANATKAVVLPTAVAGDAITVTNTVTTVSQTLKVYPATGAAVNALSANAVFLMLPGEEITFYAESATQWRVHGRRLARGQATTASAADTIVTGLNTVVSVVASFETDPADANTFVSAQIGNQSGAPAAGSIIIKTWKTADGSDVTPAAATSFSMLVNWIATGT
jgi:hypothetical protein